MKSTKKSTKKAPKRTQRKCLWYRPDMNTCKIDNRMCQVKGCDAYERRT